MRNDFVALIFAIVLTANECHGYRILGLFPLPIKSHGIFFGKVMSELAYRGHEVHVVSHFPHLPPIPNYHDININGSLPESVGKISVQRITNRGALGKMKYIFRTCGSRICKYLFNHESIINLKNSNLKFDAVIVEVYGTDCLLGFAHHFRAPIIGISGTDLLPWAADRMGNSDNPSHVPTYFVATNYKMVLYEKLQVMLTLLFSKIGYFYLSTASSELRTREFFGKDIPSLDSLVSNTSILLVNSHLSVNVPRPMAPGIIEVGGLHIESSKPLPSDLNKIMEISKEGVIYVSMGTLINMKTFPRGKLEEILGAFSKMRQNIIFSGTLYGVVIPRNVFVIPWVQQLDLLCHPNLKVFVTHGGSMSIQEAAFCATPILGIPLFPNLERNVNAYVNKGAGLSVNFEDITKEIIKKALNDLIANATYREHAAKISKIFKERPMTPLDTAVYWIEHVVKFGGDHLRLRSSDLIWFEYYLVDCFIILIFIQIIWVITVVSTLRNIPKYLNSLILLFNKFKDKKDNKTGFNKYFDDKNAKSQ